MYEDQYDIDNDDSGEFWEKKIKDKELPVIEEQSNEDIIIKATKSEDNS